uniref:Uncharacterized protein n=1 Tax=Cacopsylla melanoneura TaxID=428564 RepID=A0A8D8R833_9HEMI
MTKKKKKKKMGGGGGRETPTTIDHTTRTSSPSDSLNVCTYGPGVHKKNSGPTVSDSLIITGPTGERLRNMPVVYVLISLSFALLFLSFFLSLSLSLSFSFFCKIET